MYTSRSTSGILVALYQECYTSSLALVIYYYYYAAFYFLVRSLYLLSGDGMINLEEFQNIFDIREWVVVPISEVYAVFHVTWLYRYLLHNYWYDNGGYF